MQRRAKVPPAHHTQVTVQAGPRGTTCTENTYTSAKKLSILSFPPLSPSSLHSFTCSSTLVITTTINHMISACSRANEKDYKKGALVRGTARGVLLRPTQHPFRGSTPLRERGRERERAKYLHYLLATRLGKIEEYLKLVCVFIQIRRAMRLRPRERERERGRERLLTWEIS